MEFDFKKIVDILIEKCKSKEGIVYTSEAELQFDLMRIIEKEYPSASVRCELEPDVDLEIGTELNLKKVIKIDIVVFVDGGMYPIEIKFRKTSLSKSCKEGSLSIIYRDQDAPDDAAYCYINDIYRIEQFCKKYHEIYPSMHIKGYTLFMTNQEKYKGGYNNRTAWKDINIFKYDKKVMIPSSGNGKINGIERAFILKRAYQAEWNEFEIQENKFYLFWNEIHS